MNNYFALQKAGKWQITLLISLMLNIQLTGGLFSQHVLEANIINGKRWGDGFMGLTSQTVMTQHIFTLC